MSYYLVIINLLGIILFVLNSNLFRNKLELLLLVIATLGGSLGIVIAILLFDHQIRKQNLLVKVYSICIMFIEIFIYLLLKNGLHFNIKFIYEHNWIIIYLILINILSFITFGIDKYRAKKNYYRISLFTLFTICFLGGSLGGIIGMYIFHHKTNKNYFVIGLPMILIMQIVVFYYIGCLI